MGNPRSSWLRHNPSVMEFFYYLPEVQGFRRAIVQAVGSEAGSLVANIDDKHAALCRAHIHSHQHCQTPVPVHHRVTGSMTLPRIIKNQRQMGPPASHMIIYSIQKLLRGMTKSSQNI
jgi:hypothetical protein